MYLSHRDVYKGVSVSYNELEKTKYGITNIKILNAFHPFETEVSNA